MHDLAVLTTRTPLPGTVGQLVASDEVAAPSVVRVTGHSVVDDPGRTARLLTAVGEWAGPVMWEDAAAMARVTANALMPGMSGAPVVRNSDGAVVGVVSGRYNSAGGWLKDTVWVARTEDLAPLLDGVTEVTLTRAPYTAPADVLLTVTADTVRLTGPGTDTSARHGGVRSGLAEA